MSSIRREKAVRNSGIWGHSYDVLLRIVMSSRLIICGSGCISWRFMEVLCVFTFINVWIRSLWIWVVVLVVLFLWSFLVFFFLANQNLKKVFLNPFPADSMQCRKRGHILLLEFTRHQTHLPHALNSRLLFQ